MYFKKLDLIGFKSFFDKTTLHFEPGITAVVGPNGCGKSNIFDSIRWVLGEQSAKSLRGSDMQDVIFNGTDSREALGMAEVTLTFDNEQCFFNMDAPEIAITRRLFRSGESEYLLNKTTVRLKDILDLLLGTGIGAESYSIVAQGKIDLVLSSRPEDRRLVFDEASGITKYKAQKRETARKLEETDQNLLRVNDIITEVRRQIGSLERQATKARKYREVEDELKIKETNLAALTKKALIREKDSIIEELKSLESEEERLLRVINEQEARIAKRQQEIKSLEERMMAVRSEILGFENTALRNRERISFNQERLKELAKNREYFQGQIGQLRERLIQDEEKLTKVRLEYNTIREDIQQKQGLLNDKENEKSALEQAIKDSLENKANAKKRILDFVARIANAKNELTEFSSKLQYYQNRKRRLEEDKAKAYEERVIAEESLKKITEEVEAVRRAVEEVNRNISSQSGLLGQERSALNGIDSNIQELEKQKLTLESHREFLEKLKTKYEDIGESMNAVIYLDKVPVENLSGLVIKVKEQFSLNDEDRAYFDPASLKLSGEAKPIELDTAKIDEKILRLEGQLSSLRSEKQKKESCIGQINSAIAALQQSLRTQEILLANKEASRNTIREQFDRIKEEEDIIILDLNDVQKEISVVEENISVANKRLEEITIEHQQAEALILEEEENISRNGKLREDLLVVISRVKTELEALHKRITTDESTLKILEATLNHDQESLVNIENQQKEGELKEQALSDEIKAFESQTEECEARAEERSVALKEVEAQYDEVSGGAGDYLATIESDRQQLDAIKDKLYQLQMQDKDIDYRFLSLKERLMQAYHIELEAIEDVGIEADPALLSQEIRVLKDKLDSYGTVNLVAIDEYDELKKRYDFLIQQQADLTSAKEQLHQAILKINRTTKQMFMETFEKVRVEFRNYFRMLFNGGDAQVYLIDEQDPLESGIEIICRPPGKKLQNVLLLSGGEKSMSAIALIFAIFKVKPSPFCILDEIDAALDEANVDRFARMLQDFSSHSQFIVITHNKKTIANADVMYGITMEESGVSKIVSVKFSKDRPVEDKELEGETIAEPVS
ncbi:MAG: hypothetical protein FJZ09_05475 [Candidatus Omnitrophica bacterium]|nr:hypothetical protein [Candidatus Omnitrophota bacterium]